MPSQAVAILAVLLLRGPQTAGELRINCDRLHHFADISAVEGFLQELATRAPGALVVELARAPGTRETRWAHLVSGSPPIDAMRAPAQEPIERDGVAADAEIQALKESVLRLQSDVDALKAAVARLGAETGGAEK